MQEIPAETVGRAVVVVDQRHAALEEAGDLIIPIQTGAITEAHIAAELGELVAGAGRGRQTTEEITFFKSVGNAVQDMAVGRFAYDEALRRGLGQQVALL
jgi:ornithine cyclodeaminase/alanine dehydrogenase-like protein (mu-crystallin family)